MSVKHIIVASLALVATEALGGDLVYTPINPAFGGNPLNSTHLLATASAQKDATATDFGKTSLTGGTGGAGGLTQSDADLFVRQLQGRLLSALAGQVTDSIFGANPKNNGTVKFGATTVSFNRELGQIRLVIDDSQAGTSTEIIVPDLTVK